jgi:sec-independent protein translocase protein TatA
MGSFSAWHWIIVIAVILLLFGGKGKISNLMGDLAKGIKSFRSGMKDEPETPASQPEKVPHPTETVTRPVEAPRPEAKV